MDRMEVQRHVGKTVTWTDGSTTKEGVIERRMGPFALVRMDDGTTVRLRAEEVTLKPE